MKRNTSDKRHITMGLLLVTAALCGPTAACATQALPAPGDAIVDRSVTVRVENASFDDVRVYLIRGATRYTLGIVGAASNTPLQVPAAWLGTGTVELVAVPRTSSQAPRTTGEIRLFPGDTVEWAIDNNRATYMLRRG